MSAPELSCRSKSKTPKNHEILHAEYGVISPDACKITNEAKKNGNRIIAVGTTSLRLLESAADDNGDPAPFYRRNRHFHHAGLLQATKNHRLHHHQFPSAQIDAQFMLICAIAGTERMQGAYRYAMEHKYRFYSYGDSSILKCVNKI